jgi:hypothetical protein
VLCFKKSRLKDAYLFQKDAILELYLCSAITLLPLIRIKLSSVRCTVLLENYQPSKITFIQKDISNRNAKPLKIKANHPKLKKRQ